MIVLVRLTFAGRDDRDAFDIVNEVLDAGTLQDAVADLADDRARRLRLVSAQTDRETPPKRPRSRAGALSPDVVRAVQRVQRLVIKDARNGAELMREGWSDEVCRRVRASHTVAALAKARAHLDALLMGKE